jgi:hypothetical protein
VSFIAAPHYKQRAVTRNGKMLRRELYHDYQVHCVYYFEYILIVNIPGNGPIRRVSGYNAGMPPALWDTFDNPEKQTP